MEDAQFGSLPKDPAQLARLKARADDRSDALLAARTAKAAPTPTATTLESFEGVFDTGVRPPDTTGAIGPTRYVETTNFAWGVFERDGTLLSQGTLEDIAGDSSFCSGDPQVLWDSQTSRFYITNTDSSGGRPEPIRP